MDRRETISVKLSDIDDCIMNKIREQYSYLEEDKEELSLELVSNVKFLLYRVVRKCDVGEDSDVKQR